MRLASLALAAIVAAAASAALACDDHSPGTERGHASASRASGWISGEVREIDLDGGTLALSHAAISIWRMGPMSSMLFKTRDAGLIANLKSGDKIKFRAVLVERRPAITEMRLASN